MSLLSLSPLLSSLFISYANRVAALESASGAPSPEGEEWKTLQTTIAILRKENERLESETHEMAGNLDVAEASREAFRSQALSLKEINATQQDDVNSLRAELSEVKDKYDRLAEDSITERAALQVQVLDLEAQRRELKETVVEQQVKISKLERRIVPPCRPPSPPSPTFSPSIPSSPILPVPAPLPCPPLAQTPSSNTHGKNGSQGILPPSILYGFNKK